MRSFACRGVGRRGVLPSTGRGVEDVAGSCPEPASALSAALSPPGREVDSCFPIAPLGVGQCLIRRIAVGGRLPFRLQKW